MSLANLSNHVMNRFQSFLRGALCATCGGWTEVGRLVHQGVHRYKVGKVQVENFRRTLEAVGYTGIGVLPWYTLQHSALIRDPCSSSVPYWTEAGSQCKLKITPLLGI